MIEAAAGATTTHQKVVGKKALEFSFSTFGKMDGLGKKETLFLVDYCGSYAFGSTSWKV